MPARGKASFSGPALLLLEIDGRQVDTSELPSLNELGVTAGTLEAAEEIAGFSDVPGLD